MHVGEERSNISPAALSPYGAPYSRPQTSYSEGSAPPPYNYTHTGNERPNTLPRPISTFSKLRVARYSEERWERTPSLRLLASSQHSLHLQFQRELASTPRTLNLSGGNLAVGSSGVAGSCWQERQEIGAHGLLASSNPPRARASRRRPSYRYAQLPAGADWLEASATTVDSSASSSETEHSQRPPFSSISKKNKRALRIELPPPVTTLDDSFCRS